MSNNAPSTLDQAIALMSWTTIGVILYTLSFVLYCLCAHLAYLRLRGPDLDRPMILSFALASVLVICATMSAVLNNQYARIIFIDYNFLPGGPLGTQAQSRATTVQQINALASFAIECLVRGALLWRVWVVYNGTRFALLVIIPVSLIYLAFVASYVLCVSITWPTLKGGLAVLKTSVRTLDIVTETNVSLEAASTIIMAFMIALRLMIARQTHIKLMGKTDLAAQYLGIAALLIESYAFSAVWTIGYLIAYALKNPASRNFFNPSSVQVQILSYLLILYRVLLGRAWNQRSQMQLSTMQWGPNPNVLSTTEVRGDSGKDGVSTGTTQIEVSSVVFTSRTNV